MGLLLLFLAVAPLVSSDDFTSGTSCSTNNDRIDPGTGKFSSDCDHTSFCSAAVNGTCQPRLCRRDQFPSGFGNATVPPLCKAGSYCPDEGSGCKPLEAVGQPCQLDRDEQCAPPPTSDNWASDRNFNGSICLKSTCMFANMTLGQPCVRDVHTYSDSSGYSVTITRHNCQTPLFYCHPDLNVCIPAKFLGLSCGAHQECLSYNCSPQGVCADPVGTPVRVKPWQFAVTGMSVVAAMSAVVFVLTLVHKRLQLQRRREIREYYEEQVMLRRSLAALHVAAADRYRKEKWSP